jgi:hypothetical protein
MIHGLIHKKNPQPYTSKTHRELKKPSKTMPCNHGAKITSFHRNVKPLRIAKSSSQYHESSILDTCTTSNI